MTHCKHWSDLFSLIQICKTLIFRKLSSILISQHLGRKSGLVVSKLDWQSKSCGFETRLIQIPRWKWSQSHSKTNPCTHHSRINPWTQFWFIWKYLNTLLWKHPKKLLIPLGFKSVTSFLNDPSIFVVSNFH